MKIEQVDLYHIRQKLVSPFVTSFGRQEERDSLVLALHGDGLTGWGECVATGTPGYSYETTTTAWHILGDFLIPAVLSTELTEPEELAGRLRFVRGHPMAKASLDQAAWDITSRRDALSVAQKLALPYAGGPRARVKVGVSIGIQRSIEQTLEVIQGYLDQGYGRIKLKIRPGHDVSVARAAREAFPDTPIMLDANSAYTLDDAAVFKEMDDLNLLMLEQPLSHDDIYDHSRLRPLIGTPLCLDESILSADHARYALALGACDIINIKPARVGGWSGSAQSTRPLSMRATFPCGAAVCLRQASAGPASWRWPRCPALPCPATSRLPIDTTRRTLEAGYSRLIARTARSRFRPGPVSGLVLTRIA